MSDKNYSNFEDTLTFDSGKMTKKESDIVNYVSDRFTEMDLARKSKESRRDIDDLQVKAQVNGSMDGRAEVNMPIEQNQIEMYQWQINPLLNYSIEPEGRTETTELLLAKYTLDHMIEAENVLGEIRLRDYQSAKYGTGILSEAITSESRIEWDSSDTEYYAEEYKEKKVTLRHIGIKNIPIRKVWFDENARNVEQCMDCIYEEDMSIEAFRLRFLDEDDNEIKGFKYIKSVGTNEKENTPMDYDNQTSWRNVILQHYYNIVNGQYYIIADKMWLIHEGKMRDKHRKLPFTVRQFYPSDEFYGISLPQKLESVKPYVNNFMKVALDSLWNSVSPILLMGNDQNIEDNYYDPSTINIWKFTGDSNNNVQQLQFQSNMNGIMEMIRLVEDFGIQNTGINLKAPYSSPSKTAFEAGLQKEEQNTRMQTVYQLRDEAIDESLTKLLSNIKQYAPIALGKFLMNDNGSKEFKPYEIKINGKKIDKNDKDEITGISDNEWEYDFFSLDDDTFGEWLLKVRISTPTSQTVLRSLEKAEFNTMLQNASMLKQLFPELNIGSGEDWLKRLEMIHGFETSKLYIKSENDKRAAKINEIYDSVKEFAWNLEQWWQEEMWSILDSTLQQNDPYDPWIMGANPIQDTAPAMNQEMGEVIAS